MDIIRSSICEIINTLKEVAIYICDPYHSWCEDYKEEVPCYLDVFCDCPRENCPMWKDVTFNDFLEMVANQPKYFDINLVDIDANIILKDGHYSKVSAANLKVVSFRRYSLSYTIDVCVEPGALFNVEHIVESNEEEKEPEMDVFKEFEDMLYKITYLGSDGKYHIRNTDPDEVTELVNKYIMFKEKQNGLL